MARSASRPIAAWAICPRRLRNYLVRLGWSHGDQEIFSTEEMIAAFDLGSIGRSPARFDFAKLENLNGHYMRQTDDERARAGYREDLCRSSAARRGILADTFTPALRAEARRRHAGPEGARQDPRGTPRQRLLPLCAAPAALDEKAASLLADGRRAPRRHCREARGCFRLDRLQSVEAVVREHAEALGAKLGQVAQPLRAALTGRATSPGLFDVMAVLGSDETLSRLRDQIERCARCIARRISPLDVLAPFHTDKLPKRAIIPRPANLWFGSPGGTFSASRGCSRLLPGLLLKGP